MKSNMLFLVMTLILVAGIGIFVFATGNVNEQKISISSDKDVQIVKIYVSGAKYVLEPSTVKKGIPVRIQADISRTPGCSRSFVIPAFNVMAIFSEAKNYVEFTPDKVGTFNVACSMNMYRGTITVTESDGTASGYVEKQAASTGGSCGASGGGCGCGGGF